MHKKGNVLEMGYDDILAYLKNRHPILMIDNACVEPGVRASSKIKLSGDEWYFACHFPGDPLVPGVLQFEALFNTSALTVKTLAGMKKKTTNISRVNNASFNFSIRPGDCMMVEVKVTKPYRRGCTWLKGRILVKDKVACESEFVLSVPEDMVIRGE